MTEEQEGRLGIFRSWGWVYGTVIIYGVVVIGILAFLTRILNFGAAS